MPSNKEGEVRRLHTPEKDGHSLEHHTRDPPTKSLLGSGEKNPLGDGALTDPFFRSPIGASLVSQFMIVNNNLRLQQGKPFMSANAWLVSLSPHCRGARRALAKFQLLDDVDLPV